MTNPLERKIFRISPKTTNAWLASYDRIESNFCLAVADDIIANARELEGGINWSEILANQTFVTSHGRSRYSGKSAIARSVAVTVGTVALQMGWNMDTPEVVYMSGYHFFWELGKTVGYLTKRIQAAEERIFITEEAKQTTIKRETDYANQLNSFREKLGQSLDVFAHQNLPPENLDIYLEILGEITYPLHKEIRYKRYAIFQLLKAGDIAGAARILTRTKIAKYHLSVS